MKRYTRDTLTAYGILAPVFALIMVFMYYPPLLGVFRSLFDWSIGKQAKFVLFRNYAYYFTYPDTPHELLNVSYFLISGFLTGVVMPFIMAEMLYFLRSPLGKSVYRRLIMLPMVVPWVVILLLWKHLYDPSLGPVNELARRLGLHVLDINWLGGANTAIWSIIFVGFPWMAGLGTLIFYGGLLQLPESFFESCVLEGAKKRTVIFAIQVPLLTKQFGLQATLTAISAVTQFNNVLIMTNGGPGFATMVSGSTMYKRAFVYNQYGLASAIGVVLFLIAMVITVLINRLTSTKESDY